MRKARAARWLLWAGLVSLVLEASAEASAACLTRDEADAAVTYALPTIVEGLRKSCMAALPATAPLIEAGPVMAARYRAEAHNVWPLARQALSKMLGRGVAAAIGDDASKVLFETAIAQTVSEHVKPADCRAVDRIGDTLQLLPTRNTAFLVSSLLELLAQKDGRFRLFSICPSPVAP